MLSIMQENGYSLSIILSIIIAQGYLMACCHSPVHTGHPHAAPPEYTQKTNLLYLTITLTWAWFGFPSF